MTELKDLGLQSLKLNINDNIIETFYANEGDTKSRGLDIQLLKNNQEFDTTGITMKMRAKPRDKEVYEIDVSEIDMTKGMYQIIYPTIILQEGIVYAELILYKNDAIISSRKFKILVETGLVTDSAIEGHDAYPLFEKLLEASKGEGERITNEEIRQVQENERLANENTRKLNENARVEAEEIRVENNKVVSGWIENPEQFKGEDGVMTDLNETTGVGRVMVWTGTLDEYEQLEVYNEQVIYFVR